MQARMNKLSQFEMRSRSAPEAEEEDDVDLRRIVYFFSRRGRWILGIGGAIATLLFFFQILQPYQYTASARILITPPKEQNAPTTDKDSAPRDTVDSSTVDSQIEILQSRAVIGGVVDKLNLIRDPYWNPSLSPKGALSKVKQSILGLFKAPPVGHDGKDQSGQRQEVIDIVAGVLEARRLGATYVISLTATTDDPAQAAAFANAWIDAYLSTQMQARFTSAQKANAWLSDRLMGLKAEVADKEAKVEAYRAKTGLLTADGVSLTEQQVKDVDTNVMQARADLAEKRARLAQAREVVDSGGSVDTIAGVLNSDVIRALRTQQADVAQREANLENRYGDENPKIAQVRSEKASVEAQINSEIRRILNNLKNEVSVTEARLKTLEESAGQVHRRLEGDNTKSVQLRQLERDAAATREIYESFLAQFNELSAAQTFKSADARIVASAEPPDKPSGPRMGLALLLSIAAGLFIGILSGITLELLDDTVGSVRATEKKLSRKVLGSIPFVSRSILGDSDQPSVYFLDRPLSIYSESIRGLRASLKYGEFDPNGVKVIAIASALPNEGKTTTALALARACTMAGDRTIVLDCDARRGSLSALMGNADSGLSQVLSGKRSWRETIHKDTDSECDALCVGTGTFSSREMFGSQFNELLRELREVYDMIILDCPPILALTEARLVARAADVTVLITKWSSTPTKMASAAIDRIEEAGGDLAGVVINYARPNKMEYGELGAYPRAPQYYVS
jgi:polysaccharide biosynthesis transport protein